MYEYYCELVKVVDGDTLHVVVDLGLDTYQRQTIRLAGLNCPEMSTQAGKDAKAFVVAWFAAHASRNVFVLSTIKDKREKYGRYLGYARGVDGASLNDALLESGHAVPYMTAT